MLATHSSLLELAWRPSASQVSATSENVLPGLHSRLDALARERGAQLGSRADISREAALGSEKVSHRFIAIGQDNRGSGQAICFLGRGVAMHKQTDEAASAHTILLVWTLNRK